MVGAGDLLSFEFAGHYLFIPQRKHTQKIGFVLCFCKFLPIVQTLQLFGDCIVEERHNVDLIPSVVHFVAV